ncbi:hypothetical protein GN956_G9587 [Arapaima gigas]
MHFVFNKIVIYCSTDRWRCSPVQSQQLSRGTVSTRWRSGCEGKPGGTKRSRFTRSGSCDTAASNRPATRGRFLRCGPPKEPEWRGTAGESAFRCALQLRRCQTAKFLQPLFKGKHMAATATRT